MASLYRGHQLLVTGAAAMPTQTQQLPRERAGKHVVLSKARGGGRSRVEQ